MRKLMLLVGLVPALAWSAEPCTEVAGREILTEAVMSMQDLKAKGATERQVLQGIGRNDELPPGLKAAFYEGVGYIYAPGDYSISLIVQMMQFACEDAAS
ncbi:hypothetical protein L861_13950 [Litchfieldella anticariensis FP35 = DSM 16096]|uniref:Lipoprotein n=1 Tax=Litchfieldella anticariensis (strain DSM 16096 / CECT 5854 / CIP 108499 / LMG 22089 / FP35) TaxID=1121939 RepID=S2KDW0_LITA3|nr:hypothetical protein [Halomonas anticariensis]EPC00372.1 hypothetical protein L861_13950 [Halomonas anticariensis FP35 = DSM 16096]